MPPRYRLLDLASSGRGASAEKRWDYARFYFGVNVLTRQRRHRFDPISGPGSGRPLRPGRTALSGMVPEAGNGVSPAGDLDQVLELRYHPEWLAPGRHPLDVVEGVPEGLIPVLPR